MNETTLSHLNYTIGRDTNGDEDHEEGGAMVKMVCVPPFSILPSDELQAEEVRFNIQSLTSTTLIEPSLDKDKYKKAFPPRDMWKEYLSWRGNSKTKHEERTVVYSFWKNDFFKTLEKNTWVVGDNMDLLMMHVQLKMHWRADLCIYEFTTLDS
ncbi:hypothetical protein E5676_scaffold5463G00040 [Cucumis melo var. makuwa]|uniref:Ulp1-like peptidase n=1 Tax=Cucumis melo var. makuwa TaxID=1194695 RepID=A0A5A7V1R0_CUCMM|nr:hypothetical protein E6C27_scaffold455G00800 [Cucumis melo var. makuwa]TYK09373.1 hypothetical protein E5676_scaffold5463G00040 [Cucumis melo var. makuwa]